MKLNFNKIDIFDFENFIIYEYDNYDKYLLFKNKNFIKALFSSPLNSLKMVLDDANEDEKLIDSILSDKNIEIIRLIKEEYLNECIENNISGFSGTLFSDCMLSKTNFFLDFDSPVIATVLLENASMEVQHEFLEKNMNSKHLNELYYLLRFKTPLTNQDLALIDKIKNKLDTNAAPFYTNFNKNIVTDLLNNAYYSYFSDKDISHLAYEYANKNIEILPDEVFKDKTFFKSLIYYANNNPETLLEILKNIEKNNTSLYPDYKILFDKIIDKKEKKDNKDIAYRFFQDYIDNLNKNIKVILDYCNSNNEYKKLIDSTTYKLYKDLFLGNINDYNKLYKKLSLRDNHAETLYNNLDLARSMFEKDLKDALTPLNESLYKEKDVNIHVYDGGPFAFIVHASLNKKEYDKNGFSDIIYKKLNPKNKSNLPYLSTSFICDNNLLVFNKNSIIYGFNNLKNMQMVSANFHDSYINNYNKEELITYPPTYLNLKDFSNHNFYSEIVFNPTKLIPDFIVCFDKIDDHDLEVAKKLKIDIVVIYSKKYKKRYIEYNFNDLNKYK